MECGTYLEQNHRKWMPLCTAGNGYPYIKSRRLLLFFFFLTQLVESCPSYKLLFSLVLF